MQYCEHCKVYIRGNRKKCPLCQNSLMKAGNDEEEVFPELPVTYQNHIIFRMLIFLSISIIVISFAINAMFPTKVNWSMIVISGILCMWLSLGVVIKKRNNIPKSIVWQVAIISILAVIWDWRTGWKGWSIDFVIPIACVVAMIVMYVTAKIMHLSVRNFIIYLLMDGIFGIIPIAFILFDILKYRYPSIICATLSIISLSAIIIFEGENIKEELNRRMHL